MWNTYELSIANSQTKLIFNKPLLNSTHNLNGERWKYQNNKLIKIDQWPDILMNENIHGPKMVEGEKYHKLQLDYKISCKTRWGKKYYRFESN